MAYVNGTLSTHVNGTYPDANPLSNVTIAGAKCGGGYRHASIKYGSSTGDATVSCENGTAVITGLEGVTKGGVWTKDLEIMVS